ncbi:MAG TPA: hypothetical protein VH858_00920 [Hyphomicrobiales bacterium]
MTLTFWRRPPEHGRRRDNRLSLFHTLLLAGLTIVVGGMTMNSAAQAQSNQTRVLLTEPVGSGSIGKASSLIRIEQPMSGKAKKKAEKSRQDDCQGDDCEGSSLSANPYADEVYCDQFPKSQQCYCEANPDAKRCKGRI